MSAQDIIGRIKCDGFEFRTACAEVHGETRHGALVLEVGKRVPCTATGADNGVQWGRPWLIPNGWSEAKVLATVLTACKFWLEHELREAFTVEYSGIRGLSTPFYPEH